MGGTDFSSAPSSGLSGLADSEAADSVGTGKLMASSMFELSAFSVSAGVESSILSGEPSFGSVGLTEES